MELSMAGLAFVALGFAALTVVRARSPVVARVCFVMAACVFALALAAWGRSVDMSPTWRVVLTAVASAIIGVVTVECYRWASPESPRVNGDAARQIELAQQQVAELAELKRQGEQTRERQDRLEAETKAAAAAAERERSAERRHAAEAAAAREEEERRAAIIQAAKRIVDGFRDQYVISRPDGVSTGMFSGTEPVPDDWANARLKDLGVPFTYRGHPGGGYYLDPQRHAFDKQ